jgi:hypothetical protein
MGWGRVDPAPPAFINTLPKGEETKDKKGRNQERETDSFLREKRGTKGRKQLGFF